MADLLDDHDDEIEEFDDLDAVEDKTEPETHLTDESDIAVAAWMKMDDGHLPHCQMPMIFHK